MMRLVLKIHVLCMGITIFGGRGGENLEGRGRTIGTMKFSLSFRNSISDGDKSSECGCYRGTFPMGNNFH